jgi:hypothetical protein
MYGQILVPVDGSRTATLGLREALRLAHDHGAHIRLIHVLDELAAATAAPAGDVLVGAVARRRYVNPQRGCRSGRGSGYYLLAAGCSPGHTLPVPLSTALSH